MDTPAAPPSVPPLPFPESPVTKKGVPFLPTVLSIITIFLLLSTGFLVYQNMQLKNQIAELLPPTPTPRPSESPPQDPTANWKTYTNTTYGFSLKYPQSTNASDKFTDDIMEINGLDSLVIQIVPIVSGGDPSRWWNGQQVESYTKKPTSCFSKEVTTIVKSLSPPNDNLLNIGKNILILNNFHSTINTCAEPPEVQILLIPMNGNIIKITYDRAILSEQILSTFRFTDQSPTPTCRPRPACLDATPRCLIPETSDMCPKASPAPPATYTCPPNGYVDCMPVLTPEKQRACSADAMTWYRTNCPDFKGRAL